MEQQLLQEIQDIKSILARIVGSADQAVEHRFSVEALDQMAAAFQRLAIDRGDWVKNAQIAHYIKSAPWNAGKFIREHFEFTNWFKRGHEFLYSKKDLAALAQELTDRNIDLKRYVEFVADKAAFDKKAAAKATPKEKPAHRKGYRVPQGIRNIQTTAIPKPDPEIVRQDLARLKAEFKTGNFAAYIDVYKGTHAMLKHLYHFQKYLEPGLKRRCTKWREEFNYVNTALQLITGKKEKFNAPPDLTTIQL
jgi:hypothetical protein